MIKKTQFKYSKYTNFLKKKPNSHLV